jgi:hypothetical protein
MSAESVALDNLVLALQMASPHIPQEVWKRYLDDAFVQAFRLVRSSQPGKTDA